ncbi:hypothetical protein SAMN02910447_03337 [Ruminococcus sp. YE71]|uniref:hypothetical protein n=1 Tax=unclassified Ruminococcus TaxID=2608920 RepID=UPI00088367E6|nr:MULTISPECIES: hypothetical protein [unclassified Ruminococcus]SDA31104.1 hypothetical protein SAMN02910446_03406 [Ruminococcus sp. YE78]SFW51055.1 hypothetical protein SAMN02910447_03337 [Ruminococcus sp. YE71]
MNDYYYKYPEDEEIIEEHFKEKLRKESKNKKKIAIIVGENLVLLLLFLMPFLEKISSLFLILIVIQVVFFFYYFKTKAQKEAVTMLSIEAYEDKMRLSYYNGRRKKVLNVSYEDIVSARFSDDEYTKFQIGIAETSNTFIEEFDILSGKKLMPNTDNLFLFSINPMSYEQFFFLYAVDELFTINGFERSKKFLKQYGNADDYLAALNESE